MPTTNTKSLKKEKTMSDSRALSVKILKDVIEKKLFFSEVKNTLQAEQSTDNAFINMLLLTTLRHLVFIKKLLKRFVQKKLPEKASFAQFALFLGTAELLYLDTPDYAVINSYVDITKKATDKYIAGFVNAVLRKISQNKQEILAQNDNSFFTAEFLRILNLDYGKATIKKIQTAAIEEPPLDITAKEHPQEIAKKLNGKLLPNGSIRLSAQGKIENLPEYDDGTWWVQDFAASLAVKTLKDIKGKRVLDLCAAPGGKTAQLAAAGAEVTALDISENRLNRLKENLERLNLSCREIICANGLEYLKNFNQSPFDAIILDAPCSATGTIRRHPELVHIKNLRDIEKQAALQADFLQNIGKALVKGGILVYCVCSISKIEGEKQITEFLQKNPDFQKLPILPQEITLEQNSSNSLAEVITPEGYIRTLPCHLSGLGGCDSFFIARLQKVK